MATMAQLEEGLRRAYDSGNMEYARILGAQIVAAKKSPADLIPGIQVAGTETPVEEPGIGQQLLGAGETALTLGTGATAGLAGMAAGGFGQIAKNILDGTFGTRQAADLVNQTAQRFAGAMTYEPRSQAGREMVGGIGQALSGLPAFVPAVGAVGMAGQTVRNMAPIAEATALRGMQATQQAAQRVGGVASGAAGRLGQVIAGGDAGIPPTPSAMGRAAGAAATPLELQRATEAQMAGLKLTEGEMRRSPEVLAWEKEKAKTPEYQAPFLERQQENNRASLVKFEQLIDETGAETGDLSNTGIKAVDTLMKGWNDEKAKTGAMYQAFRDSPEAAMPVDASPVLAFINEQPVGVSGITGVTDTARQNAVRLGVAAVDPEGQLVAIPDATLGQLEEFRKSISAIGAASPNDKRLVTVLKKQIDAVGDPVGGNITRAMRAQRQRQAQKYENRAIVSRLLLEKKGMSDPQVPIEDVFQKSILSARPSEINHLKRVLHTIGGGEGKQAWSELQGATVRHLAKSAESGIGSDNMPVISAAKLNKAVKAMDENGKLDLVLGKKAAEEMRNLNQVLQYIQTTPPMTSINNSGTARTVMALMAESAAAGAVTGVPLPIVQGMKLLRNEIKDRKIKARITQALNYKPESK